MIKANTNAWEDRSRRVKKKYFQKSCPSKSYIFNTWKAG